MKTSSKANIGWRSKGLILLLLAIAPYLNGIGNEFVYDDVAQVVRNDLVRSLDPGPVLARGSVTQGRVHFYRPLTIYSFALNYAVSGFDPLTYHVANLALHAGNTWLILAVGRRLFGPGLEAPIAAALFAVHAIHTEAVTPVVGRADLLSAFFVLLGLWLALDDRARRPGIGRHLAIGSALMAGMLSKESAIVLLPALVLLDLMRRGTEPLGATLAKRWSVYATLAAACALYVLLRVVSLGAFTEEGTATRYIENPLIEASFPVRIATAAWVVLQYVRLFAWPWPLSADYSFDQIPLLRQWSDPRLVWIVVAFLLIASAVLRVPGRLVRQTFQSPRADVDGRSAIPTLAWLGLLFLVLLAPVANIVFPIGTIMGERLTYLPSAALCLMCGVALARLAGAGHRWQRFVIVALVLVLGGNVWTTIQRNRDWRSDETLFAATVRTSPRSAKAHYNYGATLLERGRAADAEAELRQAVAIAPVYPEAHNLLGTILLARGELSAAEQEFRLAVRDAPAYAPSLANLGIVLRRRDQPREAEDVLRRAVALDPTLAIGYVNLGLLAEMRGDAAEAIDLYRRAFSLDATLDVARARADSLTAARLKPHRP